MRVPGRVRIAWENDTTLRIDTDAGLQTRLLHFDKSPQPQSDESHAIEPGRATQRPSGNASLQPGGLGVSLQQAPPSVGALKVVTTNLQSRILAQQRRAL